MERIDTSAMPRFVLNVNVAEAWIEEILDAFPSGDRVARSPLDSEVSFSRGWSVQNLAGSSPGAVSGRAALATFLSAAQEIGALEGPAGVELGMESGDDGFRFMVLSETLWPGLTMVGNDMFFSDAQFSGLHGAFEFLVAAVNEGNAMLRALMEASTLVLAQLSTDPVLLTRLADSNEAIVRSVAVDNPNAPDEARVLRAMRESDEG